jgi:peptidoglycan hydrolase-like protein with peptidoglycan-binding domain
VATKGAGSPGLESTYFGPATRAALARFQKDNNINPPQGYFGSLTKAFINRLGGTTTTINTNTTTPTNTQTNTTGKHTFTKNLTLNSRDNEVIKLQQFLNSKGYTIATKGAGSPGLESTYFGQQTRVALAKWQKDNKINPSTGYFGSLTRQVVNSLGGSVNAAALPTITPTPKTTTSTTTPKYTFSKDLTLNSRDPEVIQLQKFLNSKGYTIATQGQGAPGLEGTYFGEATRLALSLWQKDNKITPAEGYFGSITREVINQ